jgi:hypothetical protein
MDHITVLKRAWEIIWRYRVLWIFGIILALTAGGSWPTARGDIDRGFQYNLDRGDIPEIPSQIVSTLIAIGLGLTCVIVILIIAAKIARYVAETALIRMVDDYEETGQKRSVRQGFRLGWSRTAWRLFLIKLLVSLPVAVAFILLFLLVLALGLLSGMVVMKNSVVAGVIGIVAAVGLFFMLIFLAIVVGAVLSLLIKFFWRACALEELGVIESIRQGFDVVRQYLKDVVLMWLIMVGMSIGWVIAMIAMTIVLLPAIILLMVVGGVVGGLPALLVFGLTNLFLDGAVPWILAGVVGIPIFALVVSAPWLFLGGLMEVFKSSVWTLTYRELRALEGMGPELDRLPEADTPDLE